MSEEKSPPKSYQFQPGNQMSKKRATKKLKIAELTEILQQHNFEVIPEMINIYRDPKTPVPVKVTILTKIADKVYPNLKSVDVNADMNVQHKEPIDLSKLSTEELAAIAAIDPKTLGIEEDEDDQSSN